AERTLPIMVLKGEADTRVSWKATPLSELLVLGLDIGSKTAPEPGAALTIGVGQLHNNPASQNIQLRVSDVDLSLQGNDQKTVPLNLNAAQPSQTFEYLERLPVSFSAHAKEHQNDQLGFSRTFGELGLGFRRDTVTFLGQKLNPVEANAGVTLSPQKL